MNFNNKNNNMNKSFKRNNKKLKINKKTQPLYKKKIIINVDNFNEIQFILFYF